MFDTEYFNKLRNDYRNIVDRKLNEEMEQGITKNPVTAEQGGGHVRETIYEMAQNIKSRNGKPPRAVTVEAIVENGHPDVVYKKQVTKPTGGGVEMLTTLMGGAKKKAPAKPKPQPVKEEVEGAIHEDKSKPVQKALKAPFPKAPFPDARKQEKKVKEAKNKAEDLPKGVAMKRRGELIKKIMKEKGMTLIEASREIKAKKMTY